MDERRYQLREFRDTDYDAFAAIENAVNPEQPISAESLRHLIESFRESSNTHLIAVADRHSGELVGIAAIFKMPFGGSRTTQWIEASVVPGRQRDGIGSHLYEAVLAEAKRRGATELQCQVQESSTSGRSFLAKRNFVERRRVWRSSLDVASADISPLASLVRTITVQGIEFTTLSREGANDVNVLRRIYDLDDEVGKDVPRDGEHAQPSFEQFRQFYFGGENVLPDAWFLAKEGDRYVGLSSAAREPAQPEVLQQYFTGVRREARRRKLALALKLMVIEFAKRNGYARIETSNDSLNAPMWTLNKRLGFRKVRETIQFACKLEGSAEVRTPTGS
jgi:mycothiol synthase